MEAGQHALSCTRCNGELRPPGREAGYHHGGVGGNHLFRPGNGIHFREDTGEFVINLVNKKLVRSTDYCGVKSGRDVDKFAQTRLTAQESIHVKAPGIKESPVNIECRVKEVKELGSHDMFIAEVVGVTVDNQYMDDRGKFNLNASGLVSYSHGEYFELGKKLGSFGYSVKKNAIKKKFTKAPVRKGKGSDKGKKN